MVNNVGVSSRMHRSFLDDDLADFQRVMSVNVLGVMAGGPAHDDRRRRVDHQHVVDRRHPGRWGLMTYRASKAALIMFAKSAAIELAHCEVRVNAIAPGNIPPPLLATTTTEKSAEELARFEHATREQMRADRPLKRERTPADIAELQIVFHTLLRRIRTLELAVPIENIPFKHDRLAYGIYELPVNW